MDMRYQQFALVDRTFYDKSRSVDPARIGFQVDFGKDWSDWERHTDSAWSMLRKRGTSLAEQGWKIHCSATLANAQKLLTLVSGYCHEHRIPFKFIPTDAELLTRNSKYVDRGGAGKFVTVYPDNDNLHETLRGLDALVGGEDGPYVLSDLRWNQGPLYVRYGAFLSQMVLDENDELVPAIRSPDGGLVPDLRTPGFAPPNWVTLPSFSQEQQDAISETGEPPNFDFDISEAIHFSNGGGVYRATRRSDGRAMVLKEARPFAGLTPDSRDAVARLLAEEKHLLRLAESPSVVTTHGSFALYGHRFLVLDYVDGQPLNSLIAQRSPAIKADSTAQAFADYRDWALRISAAIEAQISEFHGRGIVYGDLHPNNILVTPQDSVMFIDFEMAHEIADDAPVSVGAPGFVPLDGRLGEHADRYSLACVKLFLFVPLTVLLPLDPAKLDELLETAQSLFDLPDDYVNGIRTGLDIPSRTRVLESRSPMARAADRAIRTWDTDTVEGLVQIQALIARSIRASADYSRRDRAFPGDITQFEEDGFALAHGAGGVIHALSSAGLEAGPDATAWYYDAVDTREFSKVGLYDGLAGAAWLARSTDDHQRAQRIRLTLERLDYTGIASDLYGGLAGIGLLYLSDIVAGRGSTDLDAQVLSIQAIIEERFDVRATDPPEHGAPIATGKGGLMRGATGLALFSLRLFEHTKQPEHLAFAERALDYDLAHCVEVDDGSLQINEGWRAMPYLASGTAGCGLVIAQLLPHSHRAEDYRTILSKIERAAHTPFVIEPNQHNGRAGLIHFLTDLCQRGLASSEGEAALRMHVTALRLHAIRHSTGIGFPGEQMIRLSSDFATGSAGVLTALEAYRRLAFDEGAPSTFGLLPLISTSPSA